MEAWGATRVREKGQGRDKSSLVGYCIPCVVLLIDECVLWCHDAGLTEGKKMQQRLAGLRKCEEERGNVGDGWMVAMG